MNDRKSYVPPFKLNEVIVSGGVAEVMESRSTALQKGDIVTGMLGWNLYSVAKAPELRRIRSQHGADHDRVRRPWYAGVDGLFSGCWTFAIRSLARLLLFPARPVRWA